MRKAIINYFKNFNIFFPVIKSVILSVVLGTALFILDFYNVPTRVLSQIPSTILVVCVLSALIIVFCWLFHIHFFGLFLIASANILDVIFVILTCILMIIIIPEISKGSTATARKYVQKPLNPT